MQRDIKERKPNDLSTKISYILPQIMWKCHLEQTSLLLILFQGILTREKNIYMYSYDLHSELEALLWAIHTYCLRLLKMILSPT